MEKFNTPHEIKGGIFSNKTGILHFVNDFKLNDITRFYIIEQNLDNEPKAWQGHKLEEKFFMCVHGKFNIFCIKIDDWDNPSKELKPQKFLLDSKNPSVLCIPKGYANGVKALENNSKLISFSKMKLKESVEEKIRFDKDMWIDWRKI